MRGASPARGTNDTSTRDARGAHTRKLVRPSPRCTAPSGRSPASSRIFAPITRERTPRIVEASSPEEDVRREELGHGSKARAVLSSGSFPPATLAWVSVTGTSTGMPRPMKRLPSALCTPRPVKANE